MAMVRAQGRIGSALRRALAVVAVALLLTGCAKVRDQLGLGKQSPDEFNVVTRAPLSIPPDFSLRPPKPGERRPQETTAQDRARAALYGASDTTDAAGESPGLKALLKRAQADRARPDIRRILNEENAILAADNKSFVDRLMFWREKEPPGKIVDPAKESQRVQEAIALGKSPTEGETAIIKRRKKGILEGIF